MEWTRRKLAVGLVGLGVAGALIGGFGIAAAATSEPTPGPVGAAMPCLNGAGGGIGGMRGVGGMGAMMAGRSPMIAAAAGYLGLSRDELAARLRDGATLPDIAKAQGKSVDGLHDAIADAMRDRMRDHMRDGVGMGRHMGGGW